MSAIKVGVIGGDLHAWYYGILMFKHDPIALWHQEVGRGRDAAFYFYTHYADPRKIMAPTVDGFELAKIYDAQPELAGAFASIFGPTAKVCKTAEEVSEGVDLVFIPDCNGDGSDHLARSAPGLKKRVPTFVDKPFAADIQDARAMVKLANESDTPLLSLSILRTLPQAVLFRNRFAELNRPRFGVIKGGGPSLAGQIHAISLAQNLFGTGVEAVESMGRVPLAHIFLDYGQRADRPDSGVVLCCDTGPTKHAAFYVTAYSELGAILSSDLGDYEFPWGAVRNLELCRDMVQTRRPPVPYEEMLEIVAVATAAHRSHEEHRRVTLKEV